ncbi:MAG: hypothetical protein GY850_09015 [bacterium]|nr:hypothetical protein [bacterium]
MGNIRRSKLEDWGLWAKQPAGLTAKDNLDLVLGSTRKLPLRNWRTGFYFSGAADENLLIEAVKFNVPPSMAYRVLFRGEVPTGCLQAEDRK